jgi:pilus assembly protein CpaC
MKVMTHQRRNFGIVWIASAFILVIAVWGTLGLQAQGLSEAAAIAAPTATIAVPAASVVAPATTVAAPASTVAAPTPTVGAEVTTVAARATAGATRSDAPAAPGAPNTAPTSVELMVGQSTVLDVGEPIARVSLTSPEVADALVTSSKQLLLNGKTPGAISMYVWNREGTLRRYDVVVQRDISRLSDQIASLFPGESITAHSSGRNVVLSGSVTNKDVIDRVVNVAAGFTDKREEVVSLLQIAAPPTDQVLLHVRFAEVSRSALTEVGASLFTSATGIKNTLGRVTTQQFPANGYDDLTWTKRSADFGADVTSASGKLTFSDFLNLFVLSEKYDLGALIRALQSRGLFQSLAEPNLVAESGKEASFLAGGEFPIPVAQGSGANIGVSVTFKEFGVRLSFTPVINGDRVHLKVRPEVSTLDFANSVQLAGFRIPALTTRRTETEIELRDRQTFAIAGLLNNSMTNTMQKIPGIGDIPILGLLFQSKAAQKNRTELVVMITPEILRADSPGATGQLPRLQEPFLPGLDQNKSIAPPPPAFPVGAQR